MRYAAIAFFLLMIARMPVSADQDDTGFTVMTFNIHHGVGIDQKLDLERIADVIKEAGADLVALQEVDKGIKRSENRDIALELSRLTGMSCLFSNNFAFGGGEYGNAILSRFPIVEQDHRLLPKTDLPEQRGWLRAVVDVNGRKLAFWNTHIDHRGDDKERLMAVAEFTRWKEEEKYPVIFCGDFNAVPGSRTYERLNKIFDDAWVNSGEGDGFTIPVKAPARRIDFIWISRDAPFKAVRSWVPQTESSDHLPVVTKFQWKK